MKRLTIKGFHLLKKPLTFLMLGLLSLQLSAQETDNFNIPNYAPKSPEAAAFLQYGQYPVNLSSGLPNISIPIYTISVDGFSLPISLDYHASGIKVNQQASWVGLGWNLNYGAQIILSVRDEIDENQSFHAILPESAMTAHYQDHPYQFSLEPRLAESQVRDVYMFSSPTVNGEFYYKYTTDSTGEFVVYPPDAFKVETVPSDIENNLGGSMFKITDSSGNIYKLKTNETSRKRFVHGNEGTYTSAWYVDEILTPGNKSIKFEYEIDGVSEEYIFSYTSTVSSIVNMCNCTVPQGYTKSPHIILPKKEGSTTYTDTKKIRQISFNNGASRILFERSNGRTDLSQGLVPDRQNTYFTQSKLSYIKIENRNNINTQVYNYVKGYELLYSYFKDQQEFGSGRLRLDEVVPLLEGTDGHKFKYSDVKFTGNANSQDYYGYYNGINYNNDLIPPHQLTTPYEITIGSANRNVSPSHAIAEMLTEIHYPTKGWTKFNYESNDYFDKNVAQGYSVNESGAVTGVGTSNNPEGDVDTIITPDDIVYESQCEETEVCVKYYTIPFNIQNPAGTTAHISVNIYNTLNNNEIKLKGRYGRVRVISGGDTLYDEKRNKGGGSNTAFTDTAEVSLSPGSGFFVIEAWGDGLHALGSISYADLSGALIPVNEKGAGLRVASIENYDKEGDLTPQTRKVYSYTVPWNENMSSGRVVNPEIGKIFTTPERIDFNEVAICGPGSTSGEGTVYIPSASYTSSYNITSNGLYGVKGESIVYEYVKETNINVNDSSNNGYTLYKFTTGGDWYNHISTLIPTPWKRGKILEKTDYKTVGNNKYPLRKEVNTYFDDNSKTADVEGYKLRRSVYGLESIQEEPNPLNTPFNYIPGECKMLSSDLNFIFHRYNMIVPWTYLNTTEITETFYTQSNAIAREIKTLKTYNYTNPQHMQLSSEVTMASNGETLETKYYYPLDPEVAAFSAIGQLNAKHMLNVPLRVDHYRNGERINRVTTLYKDWGNGIIKPQTIQTIKGSTVDPHTRTQYTKVEAGTGNVLELKKELEGMLISYIYGYGNSLPVAKLENCAYNTILPATIQAIKDASDTGDEALLQIKLNTLRLELPNALVTTFTYDPLKGVTTITDPRFIKTSYTYDSEARLTTIKDYLDNLLIENIYHYKP